MTEFPVLFVLNALWAMALVDRRVRATLAEQSAPPQTATTVRAGAAVLTAVLLWVLLGNVLPAADDIAPRAERLRMFWAKLGVIGCVLVGLDFLMRQVMRVADNLASRQTLVNAMVGFSLMTVWPLEDNLRLGIDLAGGSQLVYQVQFSEEAVPEQKLETAERSLARVRSKLGSETVPEGRSGPEREMRSLARLLESQGILTAAQANDASTKAASLEKRVTDGELTDKTARAAEVTNWVGEVAAAAKSSGAESARDTAKSLDELHGRLESMADSTVDRKKAIEDLITTLQRRVDPASVLGLVWSFEGDRLSIQMPAPKAELGRLRDDWTTKRAALAAGNVDVADLLATVKRAAAGDTAAAAALESEIKRRSGPRGVAVAKLADAAKALVEAGRTAASAAVRAGAEKAFNDAVAAVSGANLPVAELEEALRLPLASPGGVAADYGKALAAGVKPPPGVAEKDARWAGLVRLRSEARAAELGEAVTAYDRYRSSVRSSVEDVEDLKRELRGAGVLSFHILPAIGTEVSADEYASAQDQLQRLGRRKPVPANAASRIGRFRWFRVDDGDEWAGKGYSIFTPEGTKDGYILGWDTDEYDNTGKLVARRTLKPSPLEPWKLTRVHHTMDDKGGNAVGFNFDVAGGNLFTEMTGTNLRRAMMIVIDDRGITAPSIEGVIGDRGIIHGRFTYEAVDRLVRKLNAGSLRARLSEQPISETTVGSTLGADNQRKGLNASVWSLVVVAIFAVGYYRLGGLIASLALVFNVILTLAAMVFLNASMTLPAIAGIVLTIGMAIDANVLIFERLREEREAGIPLRQAVRNGYDRAWSAILDSNLTTIISCSILAWVGSGDVRSFGVTLLLGVSVSMFTALFATRTIFDILTSAGWLKDLSFANLVGKPKVDWMSLQPAFLLLSAVLNVWATDAFFGLPLWVTLLYVPGAAALVAVIAARTVLPPWAKWAAWGTVVLPAVLPFFGKAIMGADESGDVWTPTARALGIAGAVVGAGLFLWAKGAAESVKNFAGGWSGPALIRKASYVAIVTAAVGILAGFSKVARTGAPPENFDIEFSTGTAVQVAFKPKKEKDIEEVRRLFGTLADSLRAAEVTPTTKDRYAVRFGAALARKGPGAEIAFPPERYGGADAVKAYVRGAAAGKLGGSSVQAISVVEEFTDATTGARSTRNRVQYQIKTLEDNLPLVDAALRAAFGEDLDIRESVRTDGPTLALPVPAAGPGLGLLGATAASPFHHEYAGGVVVRPGRFATGQSLSDIETRLVREINRGGEGGRGGDNIVTTFRVVPVEAGAEPGTWTRVEILGRGPVDAPRLPSDAKPDTAEYKEWQRTIAKPFQDVVDGALSKGQAFDRIVNFNPQVAEQATRSALSAVFLSWLAIIAYMWFRFGEVKWGLAGVVCLVHDVCISLGLLLAGRLVAGTGIGHALGIEDFKIDLTAVAAVLTLIGYSINDTIVVFDRIREVRGRSGVLSANLINDSINQTMSRTLLTALLTWISVVILYAFGGAGIHVFSFLMLVGILVGCYSSVAIAAPLLLIDQAARGPGAGSAGEGTDKDADEPGTAKA